MQQSTAEPTPKVMIIGPTDDYPEGCRPGEVAELLLSFLKAYNTGDVAALDHVFAEQIKWYSDGDGNLDVDGKSVDFFTTYERAEMFPYFASRQEQQERLTPLWLSIVPKTWHGGVDIVYTLRREANDLEPGQDGRSRLVTGKGAIHCPNRKIFVWSMATLPAWEAEAPYLTPGCNGTSEVEVGMARTLVVCAYGTDS